jgi:predicted GNAT superfamily acetyltransferase
VMYPPQGKGLELGKLLVLEIPSDFPALKAIDLPLALDWRVYTRATFETAFAGGYLVSDFIWDQRRSFYVLTYGEASFQENELLTTNQE